jgi:membrane glycosyltransferase
MAYAGSPLWLLFLVLSPVLFLGGHAPTENGFLFFCAMLLLLTPKLLGAAWLISSAARRQAGGGSVNILLSIAAETIYSMLLAPILMLFYTQFVWSSFFGGSTGWGRQQRSDSAGPSWGECVARHGAHTALALVVACLVAWRLPAMLPWLALVLIGPLVAIPFSRLLASQRLGSLSRQRGLFLTPEESRPPAELQPLQQLAGPELAGALPTNRVAEDAGLAQVILDPRLNAIHVSLLPERQQTPLSTHERLKEIGEKLLRQGPQTLPPQEKKILLWDADAMLALHRALWEGPTTRWHQWWQDAFRKYLKLLPEEAGAAGLEKARLPSVDCDLHDPRARTLQLAANAPRGCPQAPSAGDGTGFAHRKSKVITH